MRAGDGRVRADAAVNSGNALALAAEAERGGGGARAPSLLSEAAQAYRVALDQESDALVHKLSYSHSCTAVVQQNIECTSLQ